MESLREFCDHSPYLWPVFVVVAFLITAAIGCAFARGVRDGRDE